MTTFLLALLVGLAVGWWWRGSRSSGERPGLATRGDASPALLPEPALRWLLRAHSALGVWLAEEDEEGPSNERVIDAERLPVSEVIALDRRIEKARQEQRHGVERVESGTFVVRAAEGLAVAMLLPAGQAADGLQEVEEDLDRLREGLKRRPAIVALAQAGSDSLAIESPGSVALRLAWQLERVAQGPVLVAVRTGKTVQVGGVSGKGDRRLQDRLVPAGASLHDVAMGDLDLHTTNEPPAGGDAGDRRQSSGPWLLFPIVHGTDRVGAVAIGYREGAEPAGALLAEVLEAAREAAPRLAHGIEHAGKTLAAETDLLTGLANRGSLEAAMNRPGQAVGVLIVVDIDHFKQLNDTLGHAAGDAALVHVAGLLRSHIRGSDVAARLGGEEFGIWLPGAPLEVGQRIAERTRSRLAETPWDWQGNPWTLTASFGVAGCPDTTRSIQNLAGLADKAMYEAKRAGRNRVQVASGA